MVSNMNFPAPFAVMGFLSAVVGLFLSGLGIVVLLFLRKAKWIRVVASVVAAGAAVYLGLLFAFGLVSHEIALAPGQEKYFCEIDCHLAYSVRSAREEIRPDGRQLHITLRTRFDETTTSPARPKDVPLTPNPRQIWLIDNEGKTYTLQSTSGAPLTTPLIPGQSYETELVFRVPLGASQLRLALITPGWEERFLIGDEQSFGHKKTYLLVPSSDHPASTTS